MIAIELGFEAFFSSIIEQGKECRRLFRVGDSRVEYDMLLTWIAFIGSASVGLSERKSSGRDDGG